jgi:hypothetical protein
MTQRSTPFGNLSKLLITTTNVQPPEEQRPNPSTASKPETNLATKETRKEATQSPSAAPNASGPRPFPIPLTPNPPVKPGLTRKQTFEFTKTELEFMAETKFQLREYGITKNEIIQTGLELLAKDYRTNQEASYLVRKFSARKAGNDFA